MRRLRSALTAKFPALTFFFLAPDISTQVLNFGLAAPIDLQIVGPNGNDVETLKVAEQLAARVSVSLARSTCTWRRCPRCRS